MGRLPKRTTERRELTPWDVRRRGWVLVSMGLLLVAGMSVLGIVVARIIAQGDDPAATTRFDGTREDAIFIFALFYLVWLFGLASIAEGIWQIRHGRRHPAFTRLLAMLAIVLYLIAIAVQVFG